MRNEDCSIGGNEAQINRILTEEEKEKFCIGLVRIAEILNGIDYLSATLLADEKRLRQILSCLPFYTEKLLYMNERLADVTKISINK